MRLKYLKNLVEADDSCSEGLEYVELLLNQGKSKIKTIEQGNVEGSNFHGWVIFTDAYNHAIKCI